MKTISVPLTMEAMERLDTDTCIDGDLQELELGELDYEKLWKSGIFEELNKNLDIIIDDYEDEKIPLERLQEAITIVENLPQTNNPQTSALLDLFRVALELKTGVFFYF